MDKQRLIEYLDELVFSSTKKHFNDLQRSILEGVLNGEKYEQIGKKCHRSKNHIKDEAYKLWQLLSDILHEDINKNNFCSTIERITATNSNFFLNPLQIGNEINLCSNSNSEDEEIKQFIKETKNIIQSVKNKTKIETIPRLLKLGLSCEQIAQALDLPLELILENIKPDQK